MDTSTRYGIAYLTSTNPHDTNYDMTLYTDPEHARNVAWAMAHGFLRANGFDTVAADAFVTDAMRGYVIGDAVTVGIRGDADITLMVFEQRLPSFVGPAHGTEKTDH